MLSIKRLAWLLELVAAAVHAERPSQHAATPLSEVLRVLHRIVQRAVLMSVTQHI